MPLEMAKCPACGAEIQVPDDREDAFCAYCGTQIKAKAAVAYHRASMGGGVPVSNMPNMPTIESLMKRAEDTGDDKYYSKVLDINPDYYPVCLKLAYKYCAGKELPSNNIYGFLQSSLTGVYSSLKSRKEIMKGLQDKIILSPDQILSIRYLKKIEERDKVQIFETAAKQLRKSILDRSERYCREKIFKTTDKEKILEIAWSGATSDRIGSVTGMFGYLRAINTYIEVAKQLGLLNQQNKRLFGVFASVLIDEFMKSTTPTGKSVASADNIRRWLQNHQVYLAALYNESKAESIKNEVNP